MSTIAFPFKMRDAESDLADEVDELKRRVAEVESERDALLEALEYVVERGWLPRVAIRKAEAAIAKAKGAQE